MCIYEPNGLDVAEINARKCCPDSTYVSCFQVRNHGVPEKMMNNALLMAKEFFKLPENGRMKYYSDDHRRSIRLSTTFNVKTEKVYIWRDFLRFHSNPLEDYVHEWPPNPPSFR
jgi:isopenicillin N synthase-like dioxygenase